MTNVMSISSSKQQLMGIVQPFSHMGRQAQGKPIRWQERKRFLQDKSIKLMKERESFLGLYNSYGKN